MGLVLKYGYLNNGGYGVRFNKLFMFDLSKLLDIVK